MAAGTETCPVCAEPKKDGSQRCEKCASLYSWTALCGGCGSPVPPAASVCHECGGHPRSSGRWGRFLRSGQGALSLLVALFSVLGTLVALLSQATIFQWSSTTVTFSELPPEASKGAQRPQWLRVSAYNSGNRTAVLSGARLVSPLDGGDHETRLGLEPTRLEPDTLQVLELRISPGWEVDKLGIASLADPSYERLLTAPHRIEVGIQEFDQPPRWVAVEETPAPALQRWLRDVTVEPSQGSGP
jgi:hypothetical protein